jgi:hypothetical protein
MRELPEHPTRASHFVVPGVAAFYGKEYFLYSSQAFDSEGGGLPGPSSSESAPLPMLSTTVGVVDPLPVAPDPAALALPSSGPCVGPTSSSTHGTTTLAFAPPVLAPCSPMLSLAALPHRLPLGSPGGLFFAELPLLASGSLSGGAASPPSASGTLTPVSVTMAAAGPSTWHQALVVPQQWGGSRSVRTGRSSVRQLQPCHICLEWCRCRGTRRPAASLVFSRAGASPA